MSALTKSDLMNTSQQPPLPVQNEERPEIKKLAQRAGNILQNYKNRIDGDDEDFSVTYHALRELLQKAPKKNPPSIITECQTAFDTIQRQRHLNMIS